MDNTVVSSVALVVSVVTTVVGVINHKRIRSKCCGRDVVASVDIENTTPPRIAPAPEPIPSIVIGDKKEENK